MVTVRGIAVGAAALFLLFGGRGVLKTNTPDAAPPPAMAAAQTPGAIALHADARGHFVTSAVVNGRIVSMLVDTGATLCSFSQEEAESIGLRVGPSDFTKIVSTANGLMRVAPVRVRLIQIGPVAVRDVEAVVIPRGRLGVSLLGMSFLTRLKDFSVAGARLTLRS